MHTMEILVGFQSDRLSDLIHFVDKSGLLKRKENPCTFSCFLLYPKLQPWAKHLLTVLAWTDVNVCSTNCYTLTIHVAVISSW